MIVERLAYNLINERRLSWSGLLAFAVHREHLLPGMLTVVIWREVLAAVKKLRSSQLGKLIGAAGPKTSVRNFMPLAPLVDPMEEGCFRPELFLSEPRVCLEVTASLMVIATVYDILQEQAKPAGIAGPTAC